MLEYTGLSGETPPRVLLVLRFEPRIVGHESGGRIYGTTLDPGDSGSGAFDAQGDLVGLLTECFVGADGNCDGRGGIAVRP